MEASDFSLVVKNRYPAQILVQGRSTSFSILLSSTEYPNAELVAATGSLWRDGHDPVTLTGVVVSTTEAKFTVSAANLSALAVQPWETVNLDLTLTIEDGSDSILVDYSLRGVVTTKTLVCPINVDQLQQIYPEAAEESNGSLGSQAVLNGWLASLEWLNRQSSECQPWRLAYSGDIGRLALLYAGRFFLLKMDSSSSSVWSRQLEKVELEIREYQESLLLWVRASAEATPYRAAGKSQYGAGSKFGTFGVGTGWRI